VYSFTPVAAAAFAETEGLLLALHVDHVHRFDGDLEQRFHGRLDVALGRGQSHFEDVLVDFLQARGFFRHVRGA